MWKLIYRMELQEMVKTYQEYLIPIPVKQSAPIILYPQLKMLMLRTFMCIFRSIYDFMMKRCSFIYRYNGYTLDHIYDIWLWYGWGMRRRWNFIFWFYLGPWVFHLFLSMILEILSSSLLSLFSSYRYLPPSPPPPPILLILLLSQALVQKQGAVCSIIIKNRMVMEWGRHPTAVWGSDRS